MKKYNFLFIMLCFILLGCSKDEADVAIKHDISGFVQKGPYLNGTTITLYELSDVLAPTGKSFTTQINDNKGTFSFNGLELESQYAELMANGFYFNEVSSENSAAQLTLFAISDLKNKSTLNVNVLSHLEKSRVEYLVSNGAKFHEAKIQAQKEILQIFEIIKTDMPDSERLDISKDGDDNGILLALSVMLQGHLSVADLSELLANIGYDIKEDGKLDDNGLGVTLVNNSNVLKLDEVRSNLENRYNALGLDVTVPEFEKYVHQFIDNTGYVATNIIEYPLVYKSVLNVLADSSFTVTAGVYAMAAFLPVGRSVKIIIKPTEGNGFASAGFDAHNEKFELVNHYPDSMIWTAVGTGQMVNVLVHVGNVIDRDPVSLDFYIYENNADTWTRKKTIGNF